MVVVEEAKDVITPMFTLQLTQTLSRVSIIYEAWVGCFWKSTRTKYVWGMGTHWVRLNTYPLFYFFFEKKLDTARVRLGTGLS